MRLQTAASQKGKVSCDYFWTFPGIVDMTEVQLAVNQDVITLQGGHL